MTWQNGAEARIMTTYRWTSIILILMLGIAYHEIAAETAPEGAFDAGWSESGIWDRGKAEVATYEATRRIYGRDWPHEETRIVVAEPMRTDQHVKPEWPDEGKPTRPVLKYNVVTRIETYNYPYQLMTSLFLAREAPEQPLKAVFSSQEWCGATFKDLQFWTDPPRYTADSYWEDQAIIDEPMPWSTGALLEDQLPVSLRALRLEIGESIPCRMIPSQTGNKAQVPSLVGIKITRVEPSGVLITGEGSYAAEQQVVFRIEHLDSGQDEEALVGEFIFDSAEGHVLLHYRLRGGHEGTLKSVRWWDYWNFDSASDPGQ